MLKDFKELASFQQDLEGKKEAAVCVIGIFQLLLLQDEADLALPYVPHSILHSLNVRICAEELIDNSPKIRDSLKSAYGDTGEIIAKLSAWVHDLGYALLSEASEEAERLVKTRDIAGYKTGKGYHTRLGVVLLDTPLFGTKEQDSLLSKLDSLLHLSKSNPNAVGSKNAKDDFKIVVLDHGSDKAGRQEGLAGSGQHKLRTASTEQDILNFVIRLSDNLDADAHSRLYSHQKNPFFI